MNKTREEIIASLKEQYEKLKEEYPEFWDGELTPDATFTECNFGGICIKIDKLGEAVAVWRDWSDDAIDDKFELCEIIDVVERPYFVFKETEFYLDECLRTDYGKRGN